MGGVGGEAAGLGLERRRQGEGAALNLVATLILEHIVWIFDTSEKGRVLAGLLARDGEAGLGKTSPKADEGNAAKTDESKAVGVDKKVFADLLGKVGIAEQKVIGSKSGGHVSDKIRRHCDKTWSSTDTYGDNRARSKGPSAESIGCNVWLCIAKRTRQNSRELDLWD